MKCKRKADMGNYKIMQCRQGQELEKKRQNASQVELHPESQSYPLKTQFCPFGNSMASAHPGMVKFQ